MFQRYFIASFLLITSLVSISVEAQEPTKPREIIARKSTNETTKPESAVETEEAAPVIAIKRERKEILADNSYFVEIANNIEPGKLHTVNNCVKYPKVSRDVECSVTQEVAFNGGKQMVSYTAPFSFLSSTETKGVGDITMTYKYQFTTDEDFCSCINPRFGNRSDGKYCSRSRRWSNWNSDKYSGYQKTFKLFPRKFQFRLHFLRENEGRRCGRKSR